MSSTTFSITHITSYRYSDEVNLCHNQSRLRPRNCLYQRNKQFELTIQPTPSEFREFDDFYGNHAAFFSIQQPHRELTIKAHSIVERSYPYDYLQRLSERATLTCAQAREQLLSWQPDMHDSHEFVLPSSLIMPYDGIQHYANQSLANNRNMLEAIQELNTRIYNDFKFVPGYTTISTPLQEVFEARKGVCQDFAQMAIACIRSAGLAARYISGYIETIPPEGQERLQGADASHAWLSVYIPTIGWIDLDPTNNQLPTNQHIIVAWGRDYNDVPPIKGVIFSGGGNELSVSVDVERLK